MGTEWLSYVWPIIWRRSPDVLWTAQTKIQPSSPWFFFFFSNFFQLRHYLQKHKEWDKLCTLPSNIEHFFILTIKGTIKKVISHTYKILQEELTDNSLDMKEKWKLEIQITAWNCHAERATKLQTAVSGRNLNGKLKWGHQDLRIPQISAGGAAAWWETTHIYIPGLSVKILA